MMTTSEHSGLVPVGWRVQVRIKKVQTCTKHGITLPDEVIENDEFLQQVGQVIAIGETAFANESLFPNRRPTFKIGDWVVFPANAGAKVTTKQGDERITYRILNDDHVIGVTTDPDAIKTGVL